MNIKNVIFGMMTALVLTTTGFAADLSKEVITPSAKLNGNCSGTLVYSDRDKDTGEVKSVLLTAKHCVDGSDGYRMKVEFPVFQGHSTVGEKTFYGKILGKSYKSDLALVELDDKNTYFNDVAKVAPSDYKATIGDDVIVVGNPLGVHISISKGVYGGNQKIATMPELLHVNANIIGGNSGGAAFKVDEDIYKIIGVTCCGWSKAPWVGYYTPAEDINEYLKVALPKLYEKKKVD